MRNFLGFVIEDDVTLNEKLWDALRYSVTTMSKDPANKITIQVIIEDTIGTVLNTKLS